MKKEILYYSILTLTIALLLFFETNLFNDDAKYVSKIIDSESFEKLDIDLDCNIYVSLGDEQKVVFEGPERLLKQVDTDYDNGVLKIFCRKPNLISTWLNPIDDNEEPVNVYVKLTHSDQLIMPKSGKVISNETLMINDNQVDDLFSFNANLRELLKRLTYQIGYISLQ